MLSKVLLITISIFISSCAFRIEDEEEVRKQAVVDVVKNIERTATSNEISSEDLSIIFLESNEPKKYVLQMQWPEEVFKTIIRINEEPQLTISKSNTYFKIVDHDADLSLNIVFLNSVGGQISSLSLTHKVPKDIYIDKSISLAEGDVIKGNRLFLRNGGQIVTNGFDLEIDVNKIIIDGNSLASDADLSFSHVITTHKGVKSPLVNGPPPNSKISIRANEVIGHLRVGLVGFDGNDGKTPEQRPSPRAEKGVDGIPGELANDSQACSNDTGKLSCRHEMVCKRQPVNGGDGPRGHRGYVGQNGQDGGDTGSLVVNVLKTQDMKMSVLTYIGKSGLPSEGGPGGLGGDGGSAPRFINGCLRGLAGQRGTDGPKGVSGVQGQDGKMGLILTPDIPLKSFQL